MSSRLGRFVTRFPAPIIVGTLVIVAALGSGLPRVVIDENLKAMIPPKLESRQTLNYLEEVYGGSDVMMVAVHSGRSAFNPETLKRLAILTDSLETMPGIARVMSLSTANRIVGTEWGLEVIPFMETPPLDQAEADEIRSRVFEDQELLGQLVSEDGEWLTAIAVLDAAANPNVMLSATERLVANIGGDDEYHLAGLPVIQSMMARRLRGDIRNLIPFVMVLLAVVLFLSLRTPAGVFLPILAAVLSTVSMVGLMGHLGTTFMLINNVMPVVLLAVGVSYAIHVVVEYHEELVRLHDKTRAMEASLTHLRVPVTLAGLTTMVSFLSMLSAPLPVYAEFGAYLAFGVFMATWISLLTIPAILYLLPVPRFVTSGGGPRLVDRFLDRLAIWVPRRRKGILVGSAVVVAILAVGFSRIHMDMNPISFLPYNSALRVTDRQVNDNLGGSINLNLLFKGYVQDVEVMKAMGDIQDYLETFPETGSTVSLATVVRKINRVLNDDDPAMEVIPDTDEAIAQAILMYSMSGSPEDFEAFVDNSYEDAQVLAKMRSVSTRRTSEIARSVTSYIEQNHSDVVEVEATGMVMFLNDLADLVIRSQLRSLLISIIVLSIIAGLAYRSAAVGLLAIIPVAMTVIINFGMMGLGGFALSIPTAVISSIIIGIGVDFSFHFISRYRTELVRIGESERSAHGDAVSGAIRRVGKPILFDAIPTALGFLVLLFSGFLPVRAAGGLVSLTMIICAIGALTVLAASLTFRRSVPAGATATETDDNE
jgi:predicted RND superfamily exporter protein